MNSDRHQKYEKAFTSIPRHFYLLIILLAFALIIVGLYCAKCNDQFNLVIVNIGYGIVGSTFAAFLIDIANTKLEYEKDIMKKEELFSQYCEAFLEMRDSVLEVAEARGLADGDKRTFKEWLFYLIEDDSIHSNEEEFWGDSWPFFYSIEKIEKASVHLDNILNYYLDNKAISKDCRSSVRHVHAIAAHICRRWESGEYEQAIHTVANQLLPSFLNNNIEFKPYFEIPFCEDRWSTEEE